jgi:drug/metabolite transporter (DMT)-like permease
MPSRAASPASPRSAPSAAREPATTRRVLAYAAIYLLWGGSFLGIRDVVAVTPPFFAAGFRFVLAGGALYLMARMSGARPPNRRQLWHSFGMGVVMFGGNYACLFFAEQRLASGIAAVLTAMVPVWVFLGEWLVFRVQRLTISTLAGMALGISGVVLLSRSTTAGGIHSANGIAVMVLILGTLLFSSATLWSRRLTLPEEQTMRASLQMLLGGVVLLAFSGLCGEFGRVPAAIHAWRWHTVFSMLYLIVAASIVAFTAYTWLIHHDSATRVSSYAYVNPLVALAIGTTFAHEHMSGEEWAGSALVLAGVVATLLGKQATAPRQTASSRAAS